MTPKHWKNQVIKCGRRKLYRCICCDHELAVFSPITWEKDHWNTPFKNMFATSNDDSSAGIDYIVYHDDFLNNMPRGNK